MIYISTVSGSLSGFFPISTSAYGQSKAALNHAILSLSNELKDEGFTVVAIHPGAVGTESGDTAFKNLTENHPELMKGFEEQVITPEESVIGQIALYEKLTKEDNGKFLDYQGSEIPY